MDIQTQPHPAVGHPDSFIENGRRHITKTNDWLAVKLVALYGTAIAIWLFAMYSLIGAFVGDKTLTHMLYWSNAAQLVFCPASLYVGNLLNQQSKAKKEADHIAMTHIANVVDLIADHLDIDAPAQPLPPISNPNYRPKQMQSLGLGWGDQDSAGYDKLLDDMAREDENVATF